MDEFRRRLMMMNQGDDGDLSKIPLYFEVLESETKFTFSVNAIQYSLDNKEWVDFPADTYTPSLNVGDIIYFRASGLTPVANKGIGTFRTSGYKTFNVGGNIMSMLYGSDFKGESVLPDYAFHSLFYMNARVVDASNLILPETTSRYCYEYMFRGGSVLVYPPKLPALTLSAYCYSAMFYGCTVMTTAPELPATTLVSYCYSSMFNGCSKLNYVKALFTTTPSSSLTPNWLYRVASSGTFVKSKDATWNVSGSNGVPSGWKVITE